MAVQQASRLSWSIMTLCGFTWVMEDQMEKKAENEMEATV